MRLYLFRHAEKEHAATSNPPLSTRGFRQAQKIAQLVQDKTLPQPQLLLSSPRIRAIQTLTPVSMIAKLQLQESPELEERKNFESASQFFQRVKSHLAWVEKQESTIFMVTHMDWLEEAMVAIPADVDLSHEKYHGWPPAQCMEFEVKDGQWYVLNFRSIHE